MLKTRSYRDDTLAAPLAALHRAPSRRPLHLLDPSRAPTLSLRCTALSTTKHIHSLSMRLRLRRNPLRVRFM